MQNESIHEIVIFRLRECITEHSFLDAYEAMEKDFFRTAGGYIKRELVKTNDSEWIDIVHWESMQAARQAAEDAALNTTCMSCFKMIDEQTIKISHSRLVRSYN